MGQILRYKNRFYLKKSAMHLVRQAMLFSSLLFFDIQSTHVLAVTVSSKHHIVPQCAVARGLPLESNSHFSTETYSCDKTSVNRLPAVFDVDTLAA